MKILDTCFLIHLQREWTRGESGAARSYLEREVDEEFCVSVVTVLEFLEGYRQPGDGERFLEPFLRLEVTDRRTGDMVAAESFDVQHALPGAGTDGLGAAVGRCVDDVVTQALASWRAARVAADAEAPPASR